MYDPHATVDLSVTQKFFFSVALKTLFDPETTKVVPESQAWVTFDRSPFHTHLTRRHAAEIFGPTALSRHIPQESQISDLRHDHILGKYLEQGNNNAHTTKLPIEAYICAMQ